jgi:hypothetical protein
MLKGIGGEPELIRTMGAAGVGAYILGGLGFQAWAMARGAPFDVVAFCTAFPGGLGVAIGAAAGAVALKDKGVASARVTEAQAGGGAA